MTRLLGSALAALERSLLGMSAEDIRYTIADVRAELRADHAELKAELAALRRDLEHLAARTERPPQGEDDTAADV